MAEQPASRWRPLVAHLRTTNPYVVDTVLAAVVAVPVSIPFVYGSPGGVTLLGGLLNAGTVLPLVWRRRWPFAVATIVSVFALLVSLHHRPGQTLQYGGLVAVYTIADLGRPWQRRSLTTGVLVVVVLGAWLVQDYTAPDFMFTLLLPLTAYLLGRLAESGRTRTRALEDRAAQLEREREADAATAAAQERARIARDMHDVLAHAVSIMVVQAEAGPVVVRSDPDRAERVFDAIADSGREAMAQLRRMLGVLTGDGQVGMRAPQPTIEAIAALVAQVARTNLQVELQTAGTRRPLPPDVEVATHRIVQEALTNTVKHAAATRATVRLDWDEDHLRVTVTDDGQGAGTASNDGRAGGHGLIGIRERAAACGGVAEAGPAPDGGFRVTARLPYAQQGRPDPHARPAIGTPGPPAPTGGDAAADGR